MCVLILAVCTLELHDPYLTGVFRWPSNSRLRVHTYSLFDASPVVPIKNKAYRKIKDITL